MSWHRIDDCFKKLIIHIGYSFMVIVNASTPRVAARGVLLL
nr:MAG TPA: hypothetical protein [Caudoviricetes sp.]